MEPSEKVSAFIAGKKEWTGLLERLRRILLDSGMEETVKWGMPTYCLNGKNVAGIGAFKSYAGIWFFQGALLNDPQGVLVNAQEGKTKMLRQWRFQEGDPVNEELIRAYVEEAKQVASSK